MCEQIHWPVYVCRNSMKCWGSCPASKILTRRYDCLSQRDSCIACSKYLQILSYHECLKESILFQFLVVQPFRYQANSMGQEGYKHFLAGNIAGWGAVTATQPLDYLKTQLQIRSRLPSFRRIYQEVGLLGFYRGASSVYVSVGLVTSIEFGLFEYTTRKLNSLFQSSQRRQKVSNELLAGSITGAVTSFIYTPVEYSKILSQTQYKSKMGAAYRIFHLLKTERLQGVNKLMTGLNLTLIRQVPGSALYYGGYLIFLRQIRGKTREQATLTDTIICGGLAGVAYQCYIYPIDALKTNVQASKGTVQSLIRNKFWRTNTFQMGLGVSLIRSLMADSTNWSLYEYLRKCLKMGQSQLRF